MTPVFPSPRQYQLDLPAPEYYITAVASVCTVCRLFQSIFLLAFAVKLLYFRLLVCPSTAATDAAQWRRGEETVAHAVSSASHPITCRGFFLGYRNDCDMRKTIGGKPTGRSYYKTK